MYTLIITLSLLTGNPSSINTVTIPCFSTEMTCKDALTGIKIDYLQSQMRVLVGKCVEIH